MNLFKALQAYQSLTPDQKLFIKERTVEGTTTPDEWLKLFSKVAEYDSLRDSSASAFGGAGCGCLALGILLFIIGVSTVALLPVAILFIIVAIILATFFFKRRKDVPNHLRLFVVPLISILREEMHTGEHLYLRLDLRGGTTPDKLYSKELSKSGLRLQTKGSKIKEEYFQDPWLASSAKLADGTRLQMRVIDRVRKREEGKIRTSGKYKIKTKYKIKSRVEARLQFKRTKYAFNKVGLQVAKNEKLDVQSDAGKDTVQIRRSVISATANQPVSLYEFLDVLAKAYKQVKPV
jgi:hypothetical protein